MPKSGDTMFSFKRYLREMPEDQKNDPPVEFEGVKAGDYDRLVEAIDMVQQKHPNLREASQHLQEAADQYHEKKQRTDAAMRKNKADEA